MLTTGDISRPASIRLSRMTVARLGPVRCPVPEGGFEGAEHAAAARQYLRFSARASRPQFPTGPLPAMVGLVTDLGRTKPPGIRADEPGGAA